MAKKKHKVQIVLPVEAKHVPHVEQSELIPVTVDPSAAVPLKQATDRIPGTMTVTHGWGGDYLIFLPDEGYDLPEVLDTGTRCLAEFHKPT
jgi:hypothetical protein